MNAYRMSRRVLNPEYDWLPFHYSGHKFSISSGKSCFATIHWIPAGIQLLSPGLIEKLPPDRNSCGDRDPHTGRIGYDSRLQKFKT